MGRTRLTNGQKVKIIADYEIRFANGESKKKIAARHGIQTKQLRDWVKKKAKLASTLTKKKSINRGKQSALKPYEDEIMGWAFDQRDRGNPMSYGLIVIKAGQVYPQFRNQSSSSQWNMVRRLCIRNQFVIRKTTHVAQERSTAMEEEAQEWQANARLVLQAPNVDQKYVGNMDQVPLPHSLLPGQTLNMRGAGTVAVKSRGNPKNRSTLSLGVLANGDKLKPQLIFKGEAKGTIATRELPTFPTKNKVLLCCQPNAWQDQSNLNQWIDNIWAPHIAERPANVEPILFLDHFKCHISDQTKAKLESLGTKLVVIPAGCTFTCQPIDVGIGKPIKDRMRAKWISWVQELEDFDTSKIQARRQQIAQWLDESWEELPANIVRNSWRKTGFSYFLNEE